MVTELQLHSALNAFCDSMRNIKKHLKTHREAQDKEGLPTESENQAELTYILNALIALNDVAPRKQHYTDDTVEHTAWSCIWQELHQTQEDYGYQLGYLACAYDVVLKLKNEVVQGAAKHKEGIEGTKIGQTLAQIRRVFKQNAWTEFAAPPVPRPVREAEANARIHGVSAIDDVGALRAKFMESSLQAQGRRLLRFSSFGSHLWASSVAWEYSAIRDCVCQNALNAVAGI